jgi:hypothetical protein
VKGGGEVGSALGVAQIDAVGEVAWCTHLNGVVGEEVVDAEHEQVAIEARAVVPDRVEAQHLAVVLEEARPRRVVDHLAELRLVEARHGVLEDVVRHRGVAARLAGHLHLLGLVVRVPGQPLGGPQLRVQHVLEVAPGRPVRVHDAERARVDRELTADVQVLRWWMVWLP